MSQPPATPAATSTVIVERPVDNARGVGYMLAAITALSIMDALAKGLTMDYPLLQVVFLRSVGVSIPLGLYLLFTVGSFTGLKTQRLGQHVLRSLIGLIALCCFFYAFSQMPLANMVAIAFAAPLFVTALAVPLLGERVGWRRWSGVVIGLVGVLVMVRPGTAGFGSAALIGILATFFYALVLIFIRQMSRTETSAAIVFYYMVVAIIVSGIPMPWLWQTPDAWDWLRFLALGVIGGIGQIFMTNAFRHGEVSAIAPLEYLSILWATLFGYWFWGDIPDRWVWLGATIVMASGLYILHRESGLRLPWQRRKA